MSHGDGTVTPEDEYQEDREGRDMDLTISVLRRGRYLRQGTLGLTLNIPMRLSTSYLSSLVALTDRLAGLQANLTALRRASHRRPPKKGISIRQ